MNGFLDNLATFDQSCVSSVMLTPQLRSSLHAGGICHRLGYGFHCIAGPYCRAT